MSLTLVFKNCWPRLYAYCYTQMNQIKHEITNLYKIKIQFDYNLNIVLNKYIFIIIACQGGELPHLKSTPNGIVAYRDNITAIIANSINIY